MFLTKIHKSHNFKKYLCLRMKFWLLDVFSKCGFLGFTIRILFTLVHFLANRYRKELYNIEEVKKLFAFGLEKLVSVF